MKTVTLEVRAPEEGMDEFVQAWRNGKAQRAARTSVCSVVAGLSGLSRRSSWARVVPMRLAMAVLVNCALTMPRSSS